MARQLITSEALLCDWHAALGNNTEVDATTQRTVHQGKTIDLCGFCALVWDFCGPRIDEIKQMIQTGVLESLLRSARPPKGEDADTPMPRQLTIGAEPHTEEKPPTPAAPVAAPEGKKKHKNGARVPGIKQVICPLPHRTGSPDPYYVRLRDRNGHARGSHGKMGPEVPYVLPSADDPDYFTLTVKCFDHEACAASGGYGFEDKAGLHCHTIKSKKWPKAASADAAATRKKVTTAA